MHPISDYYKIIETFETPTGRLHRIAWQYYFPRAFLKELSRQAIDSGWMRSGEYQIKKIEKKTAIVVSDRILKDFSEMIEYLAKKYDDKKN